MRSLLKITGWLVFYIGLLAVVLVTLVLYWSYGEKKKIPVKVVDRIERVFEDISPGSKMFIGDAEVEFLSFSQGFGINLAQSYIEFGAEVVASIPQIKMKLNLSDLMWGGLRFREIDLKNPEFIISADIAVEDVGSPASKDFFALYKATIYGMFDRINKDSNAIPVEKIDLKDAVFSFKNAGKYETWKIDDANLRFFSLQNTTYLSTFVKTTLFGRESEITTNARLLENDRMMLKIEYKNLSSRAVVKFVKGLDWFNALQPVLNGTSSVVMDKEGVSSTVSLDTDINYERPELVDTKIGFKGVLDLVQEDDEKIKPKIHGTVSLKDINMTKLPILWPEKYGAVIRSEVLKNYTKGTFNNVEINFDYIFGDTEFSSINSEKFSISGDIVNTDVIYNPDFPPVKNVDGKFFYDGNNVSVELERGSVGKMEFGSTKASVNGINDPKTILEIDGIAKGDITSLRPLLKSILKGRDSKFFYNTHEMSSDSEIKFYYKDNINSGFDPEVVKLDIDAKLKNVEVKNVVEGVNMTSPKLEMKIDEKGLSINGEVDLNRSPSQIKVFIGFIKENDIYLNVLSEAETTVLDKLFPGVARFADGILELEFEYKSDAERNYFAGKIDSMDAAVNFPYFAWQKAKGSFATITVGGKYIPEKAIEISELQVVSSEALSSGTAIVSLSDEVADEVYLSKLQIGGNDAEIYFNRSKIKLPSGKKEDSYIIKLNGRAFNASKLIDSFQKLASENNSMLFDMNVDDLIMANGMKLKGAKADLRCGNSECYQGNFNATIEGGGNITAYLKPEKSGDLKGIKNFSIISDDAGKMAKSFGFSNNIENGALSITGTVGATAEGEADGVIIIEDFKITQAPILSRLFSLASFTGILDILTGSGVPMKKLKGSFKIKDDYLSVAQLTSYGDSLGFTLQGNISLKDSDVDLSGAVTPSYSVNSLFGKIPLLGRMLEGKKGEGLIATNYRIKGKYPDVDIMVNPLSALTPGFLRNIWGNAETNIDKKKEKNNKKQNNSNIKQKGFPVNVKP